MALVSRGKARLEPQRERARAGDQRRVDRQPQIARDRARHVLPWTFQIVDLPQERERHHGAEPHGLEECDIRTELQIREIPLSFDTSSAPDTAPADPGDPFAQPLTGESLDALRGGDNVHTVTNVSDVNGKVDGNTASNVTSGANLVDGGAFGNATGLSTVIQNSGSNVLIQNGMFVNVQFGPPGS